MKFIICVHAIKSEGKEAVIFSDLQEGDYRKKEGKNRAPSDKSKEYKCKHWEISESLSVEKTSKPK